MREIGREGGNIRKEKRRMGNKEDKNEPGNKISETDKQEKDVKRKRK